MLAARLIAAAEESQETVIAHGLVETVEAFVQLSDAHAGRVFTCVAASCIADGSWRDDWFDELRTSSAVVVLVDVELRRLFPSWVRHGQTVLVGSLLVDDASGPWEVIVFEAMETLWIAPTDETTANLLREQVRAAEFSFEATTDHITGALVKLKAVITHLLATESRLGFTAPVS